MSQLKPDIRQTTNTSTHLNTVKCPCCSGNGMVLLPQHEHVGARIAWFRKLRGIDQATLADLVNRSRAQISNIESGRYGLPVNQLTLYAKALGVGARDLVP